MVGHSRNHLTRPEIDAHHLALAQRASGHTLSALISLPPTAEKTRHIPDKTPHPPTDLPLPVLQLAPQDSQVDIHGLNPFDIVAFDHRVGEQLLAHVAYLVLGGPVGQIQINNLPCRTEDTPSNPMALSAWRTASPCGSSTPVFNITCMRAFMAQSCFFLVQH